LSSVSKQRACAGLNEALVCDVAEDEALGPDELQACAQGDC